MSYGADKINYLQALISLLKKEGVVSFQDGDLSLELMPPDAALTASPDATPTEDSAPFGGIPTTADELNRLIEGS